MGRAARNSERVFKHAPLTLYLGWCELRLTILVARAHLVPLIVLPDSHGIGR